MKETYKKENLLNRESPLELLPNLSKYFGPKIYVKRDDVGGRGGGGNKLRKYERIIGRALEENCDTLIIAGHYQSNASRALVGAACQLGLKSIVVCKKMIPEQNTLFNKNGNALLMSLMGAEIVGIKINDDFQIELNKVSERVKHAGGKPYIIPFGGSNLLGSLGYVDCANEIIEQCDKEKINPDFVFVTTGSGGTQAGLVAGFHMKNMNTKIIGISALHNKETGTEIVDRLTKEILVDKKYKSTNNPEIIVDDNFVGDGYGIPTKKGIESIKLLAKTEALFLCPVYTSKAMSGLISYIKKGKIRDSDTVVFIHTGGMPLVHAYFDKY
ncbi:MAG: D-cysteine desulfhydrase family protein [Cellulophaga sp.]